MSDRQKLGPDAVGLRAARGSDGRLAAIAHALTAPTMPPTITTKSGIEMVADPRRFLRDGQQRGREDEKPVHKVWIDSFLMDKYEMTQALYEKVGKEPRSRCPIRRTSRARTCRWSR